MPFGFHRKDKHSAPNSPISPMSESHAQFQQFAQPNQYQNGPQSPDPRFGSGNYPVPPHAQQGYQYEKPPQQQQPQGGLEAPEFRMYRSDTNTQEEIFAPIPSQQQMSHENPKEKGSKRLSLFHRRSSQASPTDTVPQNLIFATEGSKEQEDRWEWRASQLALGADQRPTGRGRSQSTQQMDKDLQEAIKLHEAGDLENSTRLFAMLADAGNPLSQVLYGMALRHGWGCPKNEAKGAENFQKAAAASAQIEQEALRAGMKKGGAAKGELVLAIFELGNCYRYGWGLPENPEAAFKYYQAAANLGDADAMNQTAWCYLESYGLDEEMKKRSHKEMRKYMAAKYYRQAEAAGNKTMGNSWIYKPKYDNPPTK